MAIELKGRYVVVQVDSETVAPYLQVQYWPDEEHNQTRTMIANVPYKYGSAESFEEASESALLIAGAKDLLDALKAVIFAIPGGADRDSARAAIARAMPRAEVH